MSTQADSSESQAIRSEIADLEKRLQDANARLKSTGANGEVISSSPTKVLQSDGKGNASLLFQSSPDSL